VFKKRSSGFVKSRLISSKSGKWAWFKCSEHFVFKKQPKTLDGYDYSHFLKCEVFTKNSTF